MPEGETARPSDPFVPLEFRGSAALGRQLGRHEADEQVRLRCPRPRRAGGQPRGGSGAASGGGLGAPRDFGWKGREGQGSGEPGNAAGKEDTRRPGPGAGVPTHSVSAAAGRPPGRGEAGNGVTCNSKGGKAPASGAMKKNPVSMEAGAGSPCREPSGQSALCPASRHVPGEAARPGSFSFG